MTKSSCSETEIEGSTADGVEIVRLAALGPAQYDRERDAAAQRLEVRKTTLDKLVRAARGDSENRQGRALELHEPEPWDEPIDGDALLDGLRAGLERYIVLPPHAAAAIALWVVHTHVIETAHHTPRLLFKSPEMRCGKTTALNVLRRLVVRPLQAANVSTAAVYRTVEAAQPTLLVDEADTFLTKSDELRGVINSGHEKNGSVIRVDGENNEPRVFATFAATAIACIGAMPGTIEDRSIIIHMKRRKPSEPVERLRGDRAPELDDLASMAARWVADSLIALKAADVDPPAALSDRAADGWRPLLCIADLAGGDWPDLARQAAVALSASSDDEESIRTMLLKDIRAIFNKRGDEKIQSATIVSDLHELEDRPWNEYGKARKPITKTKLANLLKPFGVAPGKIRIGEATSNGYRLEQFKDAFDRYLRADTPPDQTGTWNKPQNTAGNGLFQSGTSEADVPVWNEPKPTESANCSGVPVSTPLEPDEEAYKREERLAIQQEPRLSSETREANSLLGEFPSQFDRRPSRMAKSST